MEQNKNIVKYNTNLHYKIRDIKSPLTSLSASECNNVQTLSELLTTSGSRKNFMMIPQKVQELSCWQMHTHRHPQTDTTKNNPPIYAITAWLVKQPALLCYHCVGGNHYKIQTDINVSIW